MRIWTYVATPFRLGGRGQSPLWCDVGEPMLRDRVAGFDLAVFRNPHTQAFHVAEVSSGGLCGFSRKSASEALDDVRKDLENTPSAVARAQISEAASNGRQDPLEAADRHDFWRRFK